MLRAPPHPSESLSSPEYDQATALQAPAPDLKVPGVPVKLPLAYPNFTLYPAEYPFNVYCIYPDIGSSKKRISISVNLPSRYPWLYIYAWEYPHITPYPGTSANVSSPSTSYGKPALEWLPINARLSPTYPTVGIYPPGYPWNLDSIYPPTTIDVGCCGFDVEVSLGHLDSYPESASLSSLERVVRETNRGFDLKDLPDFIHSTLFSVTSSGSLDVIDDTSLVTRATRQCLSSMPRPLRSLGKMKQPGRTRKSHRELHEEVFEGRVAWSPSGSVKILLSPFPRRGTERPALFPTRSNPADLLKGLATGYARSRAATVTPVPRSWEHIMTSAVAPSVVPPTCLPRVRSSAPPLPPVLVVSESPSPRSPLHTPIPSSRWSQVMKSIVPGLQRSKSGRTSKSRNFGN
ncbi:hypothetical protein EDC04DRAFT_2621957 [Pisolithus marmoratus]|nr:hypothetical protein EDC04DRAFT_2621957 [Pisolithus marmoratus]